MREECKGGGGRVEDEASLIKDAGEWLLECVHMWGGREEADSWGKT